MKTFLFAAVALFGLSSFSAYADDTKSDINVFTDCGIGAMMFENDTAATVSNATWDLGTTALSSKSSSPESCEGAKAKVASFIINTYPDLADQTAKGTGSHLTAMLNMAGCEAGTQATVISNIRSGFGDVLSSNASLQQQSESYYSLVQSSTAGNCNI